jgi:hypothetical protein
MTAEEAQQAAKSGSRIRHKYFTDGEFIEFKDGRFVTEDGYTIYPKYWLAEYFKDGWEIVL